ncbi:hypothetical protein AALP_AAs54686U000200 [Arabis alpina]|uniref:Protein kinase domain-containing protein n=1 Tax=Arabis alpina TaxID=50452 RepID=A0A087FZE0_ARAAL|nr:hypothetical protein AALP_AAs54686U000200 [Arabis alpina]
MNFGDYLLVVLLLGVALVQGQNESQGFISVNCGGAGYYESTTGVTYSPDDIYIYTGVARNISHDDQKPSLPQHLSTLRSFPDGNNNCYQFILTKGERYLIRAEFLYGNYDGLDNFPVFDVSIGVLETMFRYDYGATPSDANVQDRLGRHWVPYDFDSSLTPIHTKDVVNTSLIVEDPPEASMETALIPTRTDDVMSLSFEMKKPTRYDDDDKRFVQVYMYFAELYDLKDGETREFKILKNEVIWQEPFSPTYLEARVEYGKSTLPVLPGETLEFVLEKTQRSTLPPLINALEFYLLHEFSGKHTAAEDVTAVRNIKTYYRLNKPNWQGDPCSPPIYMWDGLKCDNDLYSIPTITSLNLSSNKLEGLLTPNIFNIRKLAVLDLSNNNLTGTIPGFLSQMHELKIINLRGNKFHGTIPQGLLAKSNEGLLQLSVEDNPSLCVTGHCNHDDSNNHLLAIIFASLASIVVLVSAIAGIVVFLKKRKNGQAIRNAASNIELNPNPPYNSNLPMKLELSYAEVERSTNKFARIIGRGGCGIVYHGVLESQQVAVKLLDKSSRDAYNQFIAEVGILLRVHHRNLVKLIGYCREADCMALIYEFMVNGDLKNHLSGKSGHFLSWETRLKIAIQVAHGLEYLHHGCNPPIIHRDVKIRNILLDENFEAKLGDFGLSKSLPTDEATHVSTVLAGTHGYMDPAYLTSSRLTDKSDVYSFGIVLLELITNQNANDESRERPLIADWANSMVVKGATSNIIDPKLDGQFDTKSLHDAIDLAIACINEVSGNRPGIDRVALRLNDCLALEMARIQQDYWTQSSIMPR